MNQRCRNPKNKDWGRYGGRGITVDPVFHGGNGFLRFLDELGPKPLGKSLDRVNNDKGYEPGNLRWATPRQQALNRRKKRGSSSQYPGVSWDSCSGKWRATHKRRSLGLFKSELEAARYLGLLPEQ